MWELSILISVLGTSFFLVYLARSIDAESKILQGLKFFLTGSALLLLIVNTSVPKHLIDAANSTMPQGITGVVYDALQANLSTNMFITVIIVVVFFMFVFLYILTLIFPDKFSFDKRGGEDE